MQIGGFASWARNDNTTENIREVCGCAGRVPTALGHIKERKYSGDLSLVDTRLAEQTGLDKHLQPDADSRF